MSCRSPHGHGSLAAWNCDHRHADPHRQQTRCPLPGGAQGREVPEHQRQPQRPDADGLFHGQRRHVQLQHRHPEHHRDRRSMIRRCSRGSRVRPWPIPRTTRPRRSPRRLRPPTSTTPTWPAATVQITGNYQNGQDVLSFTNTANITGSWNATNGTLTLTGPDTVADYQAALQAVKYQNTSDNPSTATRTVSFTVNDGAANSNTVDPQHHCDARSTIRRSSRGSRPPPWPIPRTTRPRPSPPRFLQAMWTTRTWPVPLSRSPATTRLGKTCWRSPTLAASPAPGMQPQAS